MERELVDIQQDHSIQYLEWNVFKMQYYFTNYVWLQIIGHVQYNATSIPRLPTLGNCMTEHCQL